MVNKWYYMLKSQQKNFSKEANEIIERTKNGYIPNKADIMDVINENREQNRNYRDLFEIEERIKCGRISYTDLEHLFELIKFDEEMKTMLRRGFELKGLLVENYDSKMKK